MKHAEKADTLAALRAGLDAPPEQPYKKIATGVRYTPAARNWASPRIL